VSIPQMFELLRKKPFVTFSLIMMIKSYLAWLVIFEDGPSWTPLLTEIPFVWLLFCLIELFASKRKLALYLGVNMLFTSIFFAAIMYYKYYGVIVTYYALQQVNQVTAVKNSVFSLMDPQYLLIFVDIIVIGVLLFSKSNRAILWKKLSATKEKRGLITAIFAVSLAICLMNVWPNRASMNEIKKAGEMGILNYEAFTILNKSKPTDIDSKEITQEAIHKLKDIKQPLTPEYWQAAAGKNVIVIQMESFQNFLINLHIEGQEITPVMNQLVKEHFYFPKFYQQVGQGNTSDAEFVVNTSFYIPPHGAATQSYADKQLPSLPKLLKSQGYTTATFHTNVVEFWNRKEMYDSLGFDHYYDQEFFGEEDMIFFGPSDEVLYSKTAEQFKSMQAAGKPFYANVISMTAHHPYTIPEEKALITLPQRYDDSLVGDYIRSQNYADQALGFFIEDLKRSGVWDNSLIVLYGDHLGLPIYSLDKTDKELMKEIYGRDYVSTDMVNIPLLIASTGVTHQAVMEQVGGQVDIMPTIANLAGISLKDHLHFGQDLLNHKTHNLLPERYYLPSGSFINSQVLFIPGSGFEDGKLLPLGKAGTVSSGASLMEYENALKLLNLSNSYVDQLPDKIPLESEISSQSE
jgi:lipoteichoic acid synthase